jgi:HK97 family phage major capsid protein
MTPEEEKALADNIKAKQAEITAALDKKADSATVETLKSQLEELKGKSFENPEVRIKSLETVSVAQGELITDLKAQLEDAKKTKAGAKTIREALAIAFETKAAEIKAIIDAGGKQKETLSLEIDLKEAVVMTTENTIGAGDTQYTLTHNTGIISTLRKRELRYLANVSVGTISTQRALWIEETDEQGTPIMIGEGDTKTQLSVKYVEKTESVKKIAVYGKVTTEMLADLPQLISYIQNNLMRRMDIVMENQLFSGDGIGDNLKGLSAYDTAFNAGSLANQVSDGNEYDVIEAIALQVELAFGNANAIFVHPSTIAKMKLLKDSTGNYIFPRWATADGLVVAGVRVIGTTAVAAGSFIGGDMTVVNVLFREILNIQIGLDGNDFIQNKKTMLMEKRLVQFVSANDTALIVSGTFVQAISDLDSTS